MKNARNLAITVLLILHLFLCGIAFAQNTTSLADTIDQLLADPALDYGIQGVLIESLEDGRVLYERNSDILLMPASNMKLIISAAIIDYLGPDYQIPTELYLTGELTDDGFLKGDVIIVGYGDAAFSDKDLQVMASMIKELGVRVVEGDIIGDDTYFDSNRLGSGWSSGYESYYYAAQISALNLNRNVLRVHLKPGLRIGDPAVIWFEPPTGYMTINNNSRTVEAGAEKSFSSIRQRAKNVVNISGRIPIDYESPGWEGRVTMEDPTLFTATVLSEMLLRESIEVKGKPVRGEKPEDARLILTHYSPPMSEKISLLNKPSDNLMAECLLKHLGAKIKDRGSARGGAEAERDFIANAGGDRNAVHISDGSGLARMNLLTPRNFVAILKYMYEHEHSDAYIDSLPTAGVDGTLRRRMIGTPGEGNVKAKTGFIGHVRGLSGYLTAASGEPIVFSILMNHHLCPARDANRIQDAILNAVIESN